MESLEQIINDEIENTNTAISKISIYIGEDGKLHFVNSKGEDIVLDFSATKTVSVTTSVICSPLTATARTSIDGETINSTSCSTPGDSSTHSNSNTVSVSV